MTWAQAATAIEEWLRAVVGTRTIARVRGLEESECRCLCNDGEPSHDIADHLA